MTYNAWASAFKHAGFTGTITKKVLDPDDAWVGLPGGTVIDTDPWADQHHVDDHNSPFEIEVDPDQMPDSKADDEQVDQQLGNRDIDGKSKPIIDPDDPQQRRTPPMWATAQAKAATWNSKPRTSAGPTKAENGRQGHVLLHFYNEKKGRKMLFDGCDIPITTIPVPLSVPERYAVVPTFLAIPIARSSCRATASATDVWPDEHLPG